MGKTLFTAYKVSLCGNQVRRDYNHGLTLAEVKRLPLGKQSDAVGEYVWAYGVGNGRAI